MLTRTRTAAGVYEVLHTETKKRYLIARCDGGWEVAALDQYGTWVVSSWSGPEGVFRRLRDAARALEQYIARRYV